MSLKKPLHKKETFEPNPEYDEKFASDPEEFVDGLDAKRYKPELMSSELAKKVKKYRGKIAKKERKQSIRYLLIFLKPYMKYMYVMIFISAITTALTIGTVFVLQHVTVLVGHRIAEYTPQSPFYNPSESTNTMAQLSVVIGYLVAIYFIVMVFSVILEFTLIWISQRVGKEIRKELFKKIQRLPLKYFDSHASGDLMSRFTNDVNNVTNALSQNFTPLMNNFFMFIGMLIGMFIESSYLTLITLALLPFLFMGMMQLVKRSQPLFKKQQRMIGIINGFAEEMISGQTIVNLFHYQKKLRKEFEGLSDDVARAAFGANTMSSIMFPWAIFFQNFVIFFTIFVGIMLYIDPAHPGYGGIGGDSNPFEAIATVTTFALFLRNFMQPIGQLGNMMSMFQSALAGAGRAFDAFDLNDEFKDYEKLILRIANVTFSARKEDLMKEATNSRRRLIRLLNNSSDVINVSGDVRAEHLDFSYVPGKQVLKDINLHALAGKTVAIVGPTGSGKSTFINLLTKFYDIESGDIKFDQYSIKNITKRSMRENVSVVLQETFMFNETVRDNIRFARMDATDEEVIEAAKIANAHHFIMQMPKGYDTALENNADVLSQGQRQLLAIARAVLSRSNLLILDEATSSVDTKTEKEIQEAMLNLMKGKTAFVIAHRLSTIQNADQILVLKDGEIIERGTHKELLGMNGFYANLYNSQFAED